MAFGCVIGALVGAICFNTDNWGWGLTINQYFLLVSLIPLVFMMPNLWYMVEFKSPKDSVPHLGELLDDIFQTLQLKAIWHTMIFVYTFYVLQIPNAAWTNFLVKGEDDYYFEVGFD
jgi:MFS family permease